MTLAKFALVSKWGSTFEYKGGGPSITVIFFSIQHITHNGCLAMNASLQKVGVHLILYFKEDSMENISQFPPISAPSPL